MSSGGTIIICGTFASPISDKTIVVYDAPGSVALKFDRAALEAVCAAANPSWDSAKVTRKVGRFLDRIDADYESWGDQAEDLGIPYTRHLPHAQS